MYLAGEQYVGTIDGPPYGPETYVVCETCNHDDHRCGGCGDDTTHAHPVCSGCWGDDD